MSDDNDGILTSRIVVNADGDWQILPPAGQITRIGTAVGGFVPPTTNNDFLVSGRAAAYGIVTAGQGFQSEGDSDVVGRIAFSGLGTSNGETVSMRLRTEEITIPVGQGMAGVISAAQMFQPQNIILLVYARVTQAPGGGATWFSVYRTGTPADEVIFQQAVAVDGVFDSSEHSDGTHDGPFHNAASVTLTIVTDANVTVSDMKVRVGIAYIQLWNFDS